MCRPQSLEPAPKLTLLAASEPRAGHFTDMVSDYSPMSGNPEPGVTAACREALDLRPAERDALGILANRSGAEFRLTHRAKIILEVASGANDSEVARRLDIHRRTVGRWRHRYLERRQAEPDKPVAVWLADADRVGRPDTFDELFWVDVTALATSDPEASGRPITHWTQRELADEVVLRGLAESISYSTIGRFLASCQLKPHRVEGWMNRKDDPNFEAQATEVKDSLVEARSRHCGVQEVTVSFDEKTGVQAKKRNAPDQPMKPGRAVRQEFEYTRHGTLVLFTMMIIQSGEVLACTGPNRTNEQTAAVLASMFARLLARGYRKIDVILDQLNTHWSAQLVTAVALLSGLDDPIQQGMEEVGRERRFWLNDPHHRIVFHFTPKHASWLNPVEIWFAVLVSKVLRRGSFASTTDLAARIQRFVAYYNQKLAHPYTYKRWKVAS